MLVLFTDRVVGLYLAVDNLGLRACPGFPGNMRCCKLSRRDTPTQTMSIAGIVILAPVHPSRAFPRLMFSHHRSSHPIPS